MNAARTRSWPSSAEVPGPTNNPAHARGYATGLVNLEAKVVVDMVDGNSGR